MLLMGKPFNPILGETFQMKAKNTMYYVEQTSHHPPINNFYIVNPNFKIYGDLRMDFFAIPTKANVKLGGSYMLEYKNGAKYKITIPGLETQGLIVGTRYMNFVGKLKIEDLTNKLTSCVNINPDERSFFGKLFSKDNFPDYFK